MSQFTDEFDLEGKTREDIESGNTVPDGWYRTRISSVELEKDTNALLMTYTVTAGPHKGAKINDRLMHPGQIDDPAKKGVAVNRRQLVASRLGLLPDTAFGGRASVNWLHAMNREAIIQVANREYPKKDRNGKPTGEMGKACGPKFDGVYSLGDKRIPVEMGGEAKDAGGSAGGVGAGANSAPPPPKRNFGTL